MRILISLTIFLGLINAGLWGQNDKFTVLYCNANSGILYQNNGQGKKVFSGLNLPTQGQLKFSSGTWANVLYKGKKKRLEGPNTYELNQLAEVILKENRSTFLGRFWRFMSNSINQSDDSEKLEKYHKEYLTNSRAGISGFGESKYAIQFPVYFSETIAESLMKFYWDSIPNLNGYTFWIESRQYEHIIFKALTKSNHLSVNLGELQLKPGAIYKWKVTAVTPDSSLAVSPTAFFSYEPEGFMEYVDEVSNSKAYQNLEPQEQDLYLVHQLEEEGFYHSAHHKYQQLIKKEPKNQLYRKLFAAFLARMNALTEAKKVITDENN